MNKLRLSELKKNDIFKIIEFEKRCNKLKQRLIDLGIAKNQIGQVINKSFFGPIEVDINGRKIAIGRGIARKILVKKFECPLF